jgi:hypothetical protein
MWDAAKDEGSLTTGIIDMDDLVRPSSPTENVDEAGNGELGSMTSNTQTEKSVPPHDSFGEDADEKTIDTDYILGQENTSAAALIDQAPVRRPSLVSYEATGLDESEPMTKKNMHLSAPRSHESSPHTTASTV